MSVRMPAEVIIGIVGCAKRKRTEPCVARDLYVSPLFQRSLHYCERTSAVTYIASALHDLVHPDRVIRPYDRTLRVYGKRLRYAWGERIAGQVASLHGAARVKLLVLAGADYVEPIRSAALRRGWAVDAPLRGLSIGGRLQWLRDALAEVTPLEAGAPRSPGSR